MSNNSILNSNNIDDLIYNFRSENLDKYIDQLREDLNEVGEIPLTELQVDNVVRFVLILNYSECITFVKEITHMTSFSNDELAIDKFYNNIELVKHFENLKNIKELLEGTND